MEMMKRFFIIGFAVSTLVLAQLAFAQDTNSSGQLAQLNNNPQPAQLNNNPQNPAQLNNNPTSTQTPVSLPNPIGAKSFTDVVANISFFLFEVAVPLTAIMVLIGGFQMITAGGNPEKFSNGRKTLTYAAIGFAIVLLAGGVAQIIQNFLGVKTP